MGKSDQVSARDENTRLEEVEGTKGKSVFMVAKAILLYTFVLQIIIIQQIIQRAMRSASSQMKTVLDVVAVLQGLFQHCRP